MFRVTLHLDPAEATCGEAYDTDFKPVRIWESLKREEAVCGHWQLRMARKRARLIACSYQTVKVSRCREDKLVMRGESMALASAVLARYHARK